MNIYTSYGFLFYFVAVGVVFVSGFIGVFSGKHVKTSKDFSVAGKQAGLIVLVGMLMTIAGGAATIGGAQLAFESGFTGSSYTLGGAVSCLLMGLFYAKQLNTSNVETIPQFISKSFGYQARIACSLITSIALFIQVTSQLLSSVALLSVVFRCNYKIALLISIIMILICVLFGGIWATGLVGIFRTVLLYTTLLFAGVLALSLAGGIAGLRDAFPRYPWFSVFGHGMGSDGASFFSVIVGFLSTQQILQAMFAGKDVRTCRNAAFISATLLPVTGFSCVLIGMYMRIAHPDMLSANVLPAFLLQYTSPIIAGLAIAALFLAVIGTASAVVLGISLMFTKDIYYLLLRKNAKDAELLLVSRITIVFVLIAASFLVKSKINTIILSWAYLSMSIRAASVFLVIVLAMHCKIKHPPKLGIIAVSAGPLAILMNIMFLKFEIHPLYIGLCVSSISLCLSISYQMINNAQKKRRKSIE